MTTTQKFRGCHSLTWRLCLGAIFAFSASARAADWPEGYIVHNGTESPDGHYGIVVPPREDGGGANYFADLKTHQVLGKIAHGDYFEGENHRRLSTVWAKDSKCCVAIYDERFGFGSIVILEPKRSGLTEIDIGKSIDQSLKTAAGEGGFDYAYFRFAADRKLLVRALSYTGNPKMDDENTRHTRLEGTFDLNSGKWTRIEAQRMNLPKPSGDGEYSPVFLELMTAYSDHTPGHLEGFSSDEDKADHLDQLMNEVYQGVRAVLPPARFEKVKKDQVAWLKRRDAASFIEKCKLMEERIEALQDLLW